MREIIGMALALVVLRVRGENGGDGQCVDGKCFVVHTDSASFDAAQRVCEEKTGHLMTIRSEKVADVLRGLLNDYSGNFWLGLRHDRCPDKSDRLKGYKWINGDATSNYSNWKNDKAVCTPMCVSVSPNDHKWTERPCADRIDGYLCEYNSTDFCQPLSVTESVVYYTPFGFTANELLKEIPTFTNATLQPLRTRHVCFEGLWHQAPWSCEVFGGGCEYKCVSDAQTRSCACQPGYKLDQNGVTCSKQDDDPCARAGCQHECTRAGDVVACTCPAGFQLGADGKSCDCKPGFIIENDVCVDFDECESSPCEHSCNNTEGSFLCECYEGYKQSPEDMRKCKLHCDRWICPAECDANIPYQCNCPEGYIQEDQFCLDIDECNDSNTCDQGCENTPGGYKCFCFDGNVELDYGKCVSEEEGSGTSAPFDIFIATTSRSPTDRRMSVSAASLLGIMICIVVCILLLVCIVHFIMKRLNKMHNYDIHKGQHDEIYFHQVIIEQNTQQMPDRYLKRDT